MPEPNAVRTCIIVHPSLQDDTLRDYQERLRRRPDDVVLRSTLAVSLAERGQMDEALTLMHEGVERYPGDAHTVSMLGHLLVQAGQLEEAAERLRTALRLQPDNPTALLHLGLALNGTGRRAEARECWRAAMARDRARAPRWARVITDRIGIPPMARRLLASYPAQDE